MGVSARIKDDPLLSKNPRLFVATASHFFDPGSSLFAFLFLALRPLTGYLLFNFILGNTLTVPFDERLYFLTYLQRCTHVFL